jgi:hypothetical protein
MVDDGIRPHLLGGLGEETKAADDAGNASRAGRADVEMGIADKGRSPTATPGNHLVDQVRRRLGFVAPQRVPAEESREPIAQPERAEEQIRHMLGLVGDNCNLHPKGVKRIEHFGHAGEGAAVDRDIGLIMNQESVKHRLKQVVRRWFAVTRFDPPHQHVACAAANGRANLLRRKRCNIGQRQRVIAGKAEVLGRIDQRAIEIKADNVEGEFGHARVNGGLL